MKTAPLVVTVATFAMVASLVALGCNKQEDQAPAPSATPMVIPPPPPVVIPPPPAPVPPPPAPPQAKVAVKIDAGPPASSVARVDAGAALPPVVVVPPIPTFDPAALPGIASGIVGGIMKALPPPIAVPPPAPSH